MDNYRLDERRDALAILNGGYKRGAKVPRCNEKGELLEFSAFCPKAYAGIDNRQMPDTMLSRSVTIRLERRLTTERVEMWLAPLNEPEAIGLRARCEQWADSAVVDALAVARPNLPAGLFNRGAEIWWPLLAIADCAGAEWPARARSAARVLYVGGDDRDNQSDEVRLLADLRAAFGDEHTISTEALLAALNGFEESPWGARRRGDGLDARGLAKMLRPYKTVEGIPIRPKPVRVGSKTPRGYHVDQFEDAFARYLPEAQHPQQAQHPAPRLEPDVADVADSPGWSTEEAEREIERLREKFGEAA
jgi:hypothetical protein